MRSFPCHCEVEIVENIVQDFDEPNSGDCKSNSHVISVVGDTPKFIDFVGVERFDSIINSHLVKVKKREAQINLFPQLMNCKFGKKTKGLKYSKYLFAWHGRFQISTINLRTSFFILFFYSSVELAIRLFLFLNFGI